MPESASVKGTLVEEIPSELKTNVAAPAVESESARARTCTVCSKFQFDESKVKVGELPKNKSESPEFVILTTLAVLGLTASRTPKVV